jgi:hypothetical protein
MNRVVLAGRRFGKTAMMREWMERAAGGQIPEGGMGNMFDDLKSAATGFVQRMDEDRKMTDEKRAAGQKVADAINQAVKNVGPQTGRRMNLTGPASLSIKTRQGTYKTKAFLGDEAFTLTGAYMGKRGDIIGIYKNTLPVDYAFMEMPLKDADEKLRGHRDYLNELQIPDYGTVIAHFESQKEQARAVETAELMTDPAFGSW